MPNIFLRGLPPENRVAENNERSEGINMVLIQHNQYVDQVMRQVRHDNMGVQDNITNVVERILVQNGLNTGLHGTNYISPLFNYVRKNELPRDSKVPKFTNFTGDTIESTVKHVASYQAEAGDLANNENLKIKYFPNSLTKNAFTWFTILPPNSIFTWAQLERAFHEQFNMGKCKISSRN